MTIGYTEQGNKPFTRLITTVSIEQQNRIPVPEFSPIDGEFVSKSLKVNTRLSLKWAATWLTFREFGSWSCWKLKEEEEVDGGRVSSEYQIIRSMFFNVLQNTSQSRLTLDVCAVFYFRYWIVCVIEIWVLATILDLLKCFLSPLFHYLQCNLSNLFRILFSKV